MGGQEYHARIAKQNRDGAFRELMEDRFVNVGLLAVKALEQAIEACAAKENLHFHQHPRTAHANRRNWIEGHHPDILESWTELWVAYSALGYEGLNGERAEKALNALDKALTLLQEREEISLGI